MTNKVKEDIRSHYLLTERRLCTLILLALNIFYKKCWAKSKANFSQNLFRIQPSDSIICGFCCSAFIEYI